MVIDSSALIAILLQESESSLLVDAIATAAACRMSVATMLEASIVIASRRGPAGLYGLDRFVSEAEIELRTVDLAQTKVARDAFLKFGNGRHPAALNYGDCFSYALAYVLAEPLLCTGGDFGKTDLRLFSFL